MKCYSQVSPWCIRQLGELYRNDFEMFGYENLGSVKNQLNQSFFNSHLVYRIYWKYHLRMIATRAFGTKLTTTGDFSLVMGSTSLHVVPKLAHETKNDKTVKFCLFSFICFSLGKLRKTIKRKLTSIFLFKFVYNEKRYITSWCFFSSSSWSWSKEIIISYFDHFVDSDPFISYINQVNKVV